MKHPVPISLLAAASLASAADWENEQVTGINKEPARVFSLPFVDRQEALGSDWRESSRVFSLNGDWRFHFAKRPEDRPRDFFQPGADLSESGTIKVPGNWQIQGHGIPIYVNQTYPFKRDEPRVTSEPPEDWTAFENRNEVGSYQRSFTIPAGWDGHNIFLHFAGVESAFHVWINGAQVGYSQDSYLPAEFNITKFLKSAPPAPRDPSPRPRPGSRHPARRHPGRPRRHPAARCERHPHRPRRRDSYERRQVSRQGRPTHRQVPQARRDPPPPPRGSRFPPRALGHRRRNHTRACEVIRRCRDPRRIRKRCCLQRISTESISSPDRGKGQ